VLPDTAFVAFEIVLHGLRRYPDYDPEGLFHEETRGCLFDLCRAKRTIDAKLGAGAVCDACRTALEASGGPVARVEALGEAIRGLAARGALVVQ
jgi:hypothetical protein